MSAAPSVPSTPFHRGEREAQARMGHDDVAAWARQAIRPFMPDQHRRFYRDQPFLVAAARDGAGRPWATLLAGKDGFVASPNPASLRIAGGPVEGDALEGAFGVGAKVGLLGIEFATRRRNRVNGRIAAVRPDCLDFSVDQSFGNCPQHIRKRLLRRVPAAPGPVRRGPALTDAQRRLVDAAETFFIASGHPGAGDGEAEGLDVSHRGGPAGFVQATTARRIVFPDYGGNRFMNTVGNLLLDPRVGLLFVDFATGGMAQISGRAEIVWDGPDLAAVPGAERLIRIEVDAVVDLPSALPLRWRDAAGATQQLRVARRVEETPEVVSLELEAADGAVLPSFKPGQYLPVALAIPGVADLVARTYSISGGAPNGGYRISVKREPAGLASNFIHDGLKAGDRIQAGPPAGDFGVPGGEAPLVLVSAGVGATPMAAMLRSLVEAARSGRRIWRLHGARDRAHDLFAAETARLVGRRDSFAARTFYSRPAAGDGAKAERLDARKILDTVGTVEADFRLCGPAAFVADLEAGLAALGVKPDRIRGESFG